MASMLLPGIALGVVVSLVAPAAAWNEPDGFRDLRWGVSESKVRAQPTWRYCEDVDKPLARALELRDLARGDAMRRLGERRCVHELKIGEIPVVADFYFKGPRGLRGVVVQFAPEQFEAMKRIFLERYGPPTSVTSSERQSRIGKTFKNESLTWKGSITSVSLEKYPRALARASLALIEDVRDPGEEARQVDDAARKGSEEQLRKGVRDLGP
jgi:hypothetical protein